MALVLASILPTIDSAQGSSKVLLEFVAHHDLVTGLGISPDGKTLISGGRDQQIRLWSSIDGQALGTSADHGSWITSVSFSPDGKMYASRGTDGVVKIWRTSDGQLLQKIEGTQTTGGFTGSVSFSPDGYRIAAALLHTNQVGMWNIATGERVRTFAGGSAPPEWVVFSPDGSVIAGAGGSRGVDTSIKIWSTKDGSLIKTIQSDNEYGLGELAFSPDGSLLAAGSDPYPSFEGNVGIWRVSDWSPMRSLPVKGDYVAFSPDGRMLALTATLGVVRRQVQIWSVESGEFVRAVDSSESNQLRGPLTFTPDGSRLIVGGVLSSNSANGTIQLGTISALSVPLLISKLQHGATGLILSVSGGSGLIQVQRSNLPGKDWENFGPPTVSSTITVPVAGTSGFYRILELAP